LTTAIAIREFARNNLGLPDNGSYSSYVEIEGEALLWNVVATEEFSLKPKTWCFPVAGCVPYRGYFKQQKAHDFARRLEARGMDVFVSPATAYSSLGWFDDPLLSTMFSGSDIRLASYLFHEMAHQRLYIKDDGAFNEGYASFVEAAGTRAWLESRQRWQDLVAWQRLRVASKDFAHLIKQTRDELARLYRSSATDTVKRVSKAEIFQALAESYEQLSSGRWDGKRYYAGWFEEPVNNARLALFNTYAGSHCAFRRLWKESDADWQKFHALAEQKSRLGKEQRRQWLTQSCPTIAHEANL
jgi:predicted aminopeptidase